MCRHPVGGIICWWAGSWPCGPQDRVQLPGCDRRGPLWRKAGLSAARGMATLSGLVGLIVYVLIMLVVLISALDCPGHRSHFWSGHCHAGKDADRSAGIVAASCFGHRLLVAKLVSDLVASLLAGIGFNRLLVWLKLGDEPQEGQRTPSRSSAISSWSSSCCWR